VSFLRKQESVSTSLNLVLGSWFLVLYNFRMTETKKNPWVAFFLTLFFPGLGHFYLGNIYSALAYGAMGAGIACTFFTSDSQLSRIAILAILPFVWIPAANDAVQAARGKKPLVTGEESKIYVIWMLCCVGPFSLPLLWQSKKFSILAKALWTTAVLSIVLFFFYLIKLAGQIL
jgi:TM2 domain-containing membrane protein YozV